MDEADEQFIKDKISELRLRLLDLTNRNALLNFRHSEKALTHIRIIDELPDFLFGSLLEGQKLTFLPLPEPHDEPHDEKTEEFQTYFREATLTDEQYLEEVVALIDEDDSFDDLAEIERNLKNRVRERLGMPPVHELKPLSNAKWARQNDLEPKYDMPEPSEEDYQADKHYDEYIQTLLKPKELGHTRAKHNLVLFTSLKPDDIKATETSALGLRAFSSSKITGRHQRRKNPNGCRV